MNQNLNEETVAEQASVVEETETTLVVSAETADKAPSFFSKLGTKKLIILGAGALAVVGIVILILMFTVFAKTPAEKLDDKINDIGVVTLKSEEAILAAESDLQAMAEEDKALLKNTELLATKRASFDKIKAAYDAIEKIGEVTLKSEEAIDDAKEALAACSEEEAKEVTNAETLTEAEKSLAKLQIAQVEELIKKIGKVTENSGEKINAADKAYNALSTEDQANVTNAETLTKAKAAFKELMKAQVNTLLGNMRLESDPVRGYKFYYPKALPYYASLGYWGADVRHFVLPYIGQTNSSTWMRLICNYTAGDWVFFEKITFAVDDERYYKSFNYHDVTRDNEYGDVWEYVDIEVGESEIELLKAIANSNQTIVRFEGDEYYRDFTVSAADKAAITQVLKAYEAAVAVQS